uniref:Auxin-induced protein n=1 Tax=Cajanus cajan TaxID=3821 RepID=A0A151SLV4_CAJCA|nr:Auxin-responsive protein IAA13 [Cajanus cajan]
MELQLALALPIPTNPSNLLHLNSTHKKRTFSQLLDHAPQTLTLLPLTPNHNITKNDHDEDVEAIVGWPPVNYLRKKLRVDNCGDEVVGNNDHMLRLDHHRHHDHGSDGVVESKSNTLYVKVKMEGVGIARKVDLGMHQSFQTLKETLMDMFGKCNPQSNTYELAYQDKEGDWLHAEDVPWRQVHHTILILKKNNQNPVKFIVPRIIIIIRILLHIHCELEFVFSLKI